MGGVAGQTGWRRAITLERAPDRAAARAAALEAVVRELRTLECGTSVRGKEG